MPNSPNSRSAAELLKAFSHATRLAILRELAAGPRCVTDMEELLPARQANISQHLAVLRNARLVDYAQDGALRCYYLSRPQLVEDMLELVGRDDPVVTRTPAEIQADKVRLANQDSAVCQRFADFEAVADPITTAPTPTPNIEPRVNSRSLRSMPVVGSPFTYKYLCNDCRSLKLPENASRRLPDCVVHFVAVAVGHILRDRRVPRDSEIDR